jgi:hypothetical protein
MNHLNDPNLIKKKITRNLRNTDYNFLDLLEEYNVENAIYYDYLSTIDEFKLKNIWNHVIKKWNHMKLELKDNKDFKNSEYININYNQIHIDINDNQLNELFTEFIGCSVLKSIFICNSIYNYIFSK